MNAVRDIVPKLILLAVAYLCMMAGLKTIDPIVVVLHYGFGGYSEGVRVSAWNPIEFTNGDVLSWWRSFPFFFLYTAGMAPFFWVGFVKIPLYLKRRHPGAWQFLFGSTKQSANSQ